MTEPSSSPPTGPPRPEAMAETSRAEGSRRAGEPARPGSSDGRARSFREAQTRRRVELRERIGVFVAAVVLVLGVYTLATARPSNGVEGGGYSPPGPPILVDLSTPVVGTVTCSAGGTAYIEQMNWSSAAAPVTTGAVNLRLYEIWDGDYIPLVSVTANVTSSNLCAGSPPNPEKLGWYAVLKDPSGASVLTYTGAQGWSSIGSQSWDMPVQNGSSLVFVSGIPLHGTGRGFLVVGFFDGSPVKGSVPL